MTVGAIGPWNDPMIVAWCKVIRLERELRETQEALETLCRGKHEQQALTGDEFTRSPLLGQT